ncbi:nucleoside phosphorylase-I family protein [Haladaptatus caseinilyticus]|uniref:phosphorylase n=1 Tax=Haladaptatus caseinilyticus TaxID=2993314 RepID=UPI00224B4909|nr:phosphorylase [Haladaptatus caseinilyticus]
MVQKRNAMIRRQFLKATGATLGAGFAGSATGETDTSPEAATDQVDVNVFVIAAFEVADLKKREGTTDAPGEFQLWYQNYDLTHTVDVPGAFAPVYHNDDGVAGTVVGIGKTNAASSLTAILRSPEFDFENAYFVTAGIAGSPPDVGTLGSVFVSDGVADWDLVHRWSRSDGEADPHAMMFRPHRPDHAYELNDGLVKTAHRLGKRVSLTDSERAKEYRKLYSQETAQSDPFVGVGTTMCGDTYWHGSTFSDQAAHIAEEYGVSTYATTEMEDFATARVLDRFGHLDRYVSLRSVSNFDQPHQCQTVQESLAADSGGFRPSVTNVYRVGSELVDELVENWNHWETRRF